MSIDNAALARKRRRYRRGGAGEEKSGMRAQKEGNGPGK